LARELGVADRFLFLGKRGDVRDILASADIAFHPSRGEAMSLAILEFMCAGLPVVLPDDPSVCTSVQHEVSGMVYRAGDVEAAGKALQRLCDDQSTRARLGARARSICLERYLLEHTNRNFMSAVVAYM
jgi:glycosyltransferase involved in cell wall biosynthesis